MGIGASNEVLPEKEIKQEVKKERSRSKSKKGTKRSKSRTGMRTTKSRTGRRSTKSKEKKAAKAGKEMERNTPEVSEMKRNTGGTLEERGVLALERVAVSMEALVRMAMIAMMMKMVMESSIKVQIPNSDADQQYSAS